VNGVHVSFDEYGSGEPVVLVTGTGGRGRDWRAHQVPALLSAGYRAITIDNRGVPPSDVGPPGFTVDDMVGDTAGLIDALGIGPCRIVGFSMGGIVVQELLLAYPDIIRQAVLMATRGRTDVMRAAISTAWDELDDASVKLPPKYEAMVRASQYLSPRTLNDETRIRDWLDILEMSQPDSAIKQAQRGLDLIDNRLEEYRKITTDCLVISFADDLIVPPLFGRELAEHIPGARHEEVAGCGHYGHLEEPEAVNDLMIGFFRTGQARTGQARI
jgi:pimeloyl-ACP methyl ester carboxylesterase